MTRPVWLLMALTVAQSPPQMPRIRYGLWEISEVTKPNGVSGRCGLQ